MAAQALQKQQDEQIKSWGDKMMAEDIQDISSHRLSESGAPWITDLTNKQLGDITAWIRMMPVTSTELGYAVKDETVLYKEETEHTDEEKTAQLKLYDALIGGFHGYRIEKWKPGYRFKMEKYSQPTWVGTTCMELSMHG
eukprot:4057101-Heterocapsa_arctica.AAC.1